jgi:hypothetical protein
MMSDPIQLKKSAKSSGIIVEINGLHEFRLLSQSTQKPGRRRSCESLMPLTRFPKFQRTERRSAFNLDTIPHITGNAMAFDGPGIGGFQLPVLCGAEEGCGEEGLTDKMTRMNFRNKQPLSPALSPLKNSRGERDGNRACLAARGAGAALSRFASTKPPTLPEVSVWMPGWWDSSPRPSMPTLFY